MFFAKLDNILDITAKQLDERFQFQKTAMAKQFLSGVSFFVVISGYAGSCP